MFFALKKLDRLLIVLFLRYFSLTLPICIFILTLQFLLKYFDRIIGKGAGTWDFIKLLFYFSATVLPMATPLSVLITALMMYGSLGEHSEIVAIKTMGISSLRMLRGTCILVLGITVMSFFVHAYFIPRASLEGYSLLYRISHQKPLFNLRTYEFYSDIPGYSIRVKEKLPEGRLRGIMLYGKKEGLITADSGHLRDSKDGNYLHLELFNGHSYAEYSPKRRRSIWNDMARSEFSRMQISFDLSSFQLQAIPEEYLANLRYGKSLPSLFHDIDSTLLSIDSLKASFNQKILTTQSAKRNYQAPVDHLSTVLSDLQSTSGEVIIPRLPAAHIIPAQDTLQQAAGPAVQSMILALSTNTPTSSVVRDAKNKAEYVRQHISQHVKNLQRPYYLLYKDELEAYKRYTLAISCLLMFLIGAFLGILIKKGGIGVPALISILFFILYYILNTTMARIATVGLIDTFLAAIFADVVLLVLLIPLYILVLKDVALTDIGGALRPMLRFLSFFKQKY